MLQLVTSLGRILHQYGQTLTCYPLSAMGTRHASKIQSAVIDVVYVFWLWRHIRVLREPPTKYADQVKRVERLLARFVSSFGIYTISISSQKVTGSVVLASDVAMPLCSNSTIIGGNCVLCMTALIRFTVFSSNNLFWGVNFEILPLISKTYLLDQWHRLPPGPLGYFAFPRCWQTTTRNWVNLMKCELCRGRG